MTTRASSRDHLIDSYTFPGFRLDILAEPEWIRIVTYRRLSAVINKRRWLDTVELVERQPHPVLVKPDWIRIPQDELQNIHSVYGFWPTDALLLAVDEYGHERVALMSRELRSRALATDSPPGEPSLVS